MSWQIFVTIDEDKSDVGSVEATCTDPNTALGTFHYTGRIQANLPSVDAFNVRAIVARDAWQTKRQENLDKAGIVLNRLIAADPKV